MPVIFTTPRGTASRIAGRPGGAPMPFQLTLQGNDIPLGSGNVSARAIITQAGIDQQGDYQFLNTISQTIYAYIFGDRMGTLRVGGVAFTSTCWGGSEQSGIGQVLETYAKNRIANAARSGAPVLVNFGETPFKGYLTEMHLELSDSENLLAPWSFTFRTFPGQ